MPYCHVVSTLPAALSSLALQNPRVVYTLLFQAVAEALQTIARDPKHLGAEIGFLGVLHTWGQTLHHHPHIHCLVPAGGLALDGTVWVPCPQRFFLPVRVLSRLFRRTFLTALRHGAAQERLSMQGQCQRWRCPSAWDQFLTTMQQTEWVVYAKPPLADPQAVLQYLARYTHRVAITNRRLLACADGQGHVLLRLPAPSAAAATVAAGPRPVSAVCPACHSGRLQVLETWFPQRRVLDVSHSLLAFDTS